MSRTPAQRPLPRSWFSHPRITILPCDYSLESLDFITQKFRPDSCVHLAWSHLQKDERNDPSHLTRSYQISVDLVQALAKAGCQHFLGVGSQAEYALTGKVEGKITVSTPPQPHTAYGLGKYITGLATKKLCEMFGMQHTWLRLLVTYGPGEDRPSFIPYAVRQAIQGLTIEMTPGEQEWDFLYMDDFSDLVQKILETRFGGIFPVGSGTTTSLKEITEVLGRLKPDIRINSSRPYGPREVFYLCADMASIQAAVGWKPKTSIEEGIRRVYEYEQGGLCTNT